MGKLGLPQSRETRAFRAFDAILREDPAIKAAGIRIMSWTGDRADNTAPATGQMPMIRITPVSRSDQSRTELASLAVLGVQVEAFVAGFEADDILDLWGAIRAALVKDKPFRNTTVACFFRDEIGMDLSEVEKPAIGASAQGDPFMDAVGVFLIKFFVRR